VKPVIRMVREYLEFPEDMLENVNVTLIKGKYDGNR